MNDNKYQSYAGLWSIARSIFMIFVVGFIAENLMTKYESNICTDEAKGNLSLALQGN